MSETQPLGKLADPETGYVSRTFIGKDLGPDVRCHRCGGRGMWGRPSDKPPHVLCLRCADDWAKCSRRLFRKHGYKDARSPKRWDAAWQDFLVIRPTKVDIAAHNLIVEAEDRAVARMWAGFIPPSST